MQFDVDPSLEHVRDAHPKCATMASPLVTDPRTSTTPRTTTAAAAATATTSPSPPADFPPCVLRQVHPPARLPCDGQGPFDAGSASYAFVIASRTHYVDCACRTRKDRRPKRSLLICCPRRRVPKTLLRARVTTWLRIRGRGRQACDLLAAGPRVHVPKMVPCAGARSDAIGVGTGVRVRG